MPFSHPLLLPKTAIAAAPFEPVLSNRVSETAQRTAVVDFAPARWRLRILTSAMSAADFAIWRAFLGAQEGGKRVFLGFDPLGGCPRAYPNGVGAPSSWPVAAWRARLDGAHPRSPAGVVALKSLPVGYAVSVGDYIGFVGAGGLGGGRALHRVLESAVADGTGRLSVQVEPPVQFAAAGDTEVTLRDATCAMRLVPGSWQGPREQRIYQVVEFEARQEF